MKVIKYKLSENIEKSMIYSEVHLAIAQKEALNGEYTIEEVEQEIVEEGEQ